MSDGDGEGPNDRRAAPPPSASPTTIDDARPRTTLDDARPTALDPLPPGVPTGAPPPGEPLPLAKTNPGLDRATIDDRHPLGATVDAPPEAGARAERTTLDDVENPSPGTTDPDGPPEELPPEPASGPKQKSRPWVYVLVGGLLFAAITGPLLFYFIVFRYNPTAVKHVPAGTHIAVRFDGQSLYLFKPFRERVLHVLDDQPGAKSRGDRLRALTGIDLRSDLREIVIASPDGQRWVVLLGGRFNEARFNRTDVVHGLRKFLEEQGKTGLTEKNGVLVTPEGIEITEADDSTVIVANDDDLLRASLQTSDEWTSLGLVGSGAMSFTLDETALDHAKGQLSGFEDAAVFAHTKRITGYLKLGSSPELSMELVPRGTDTETLAKEADAALADARLVAVFLPDVAGEQSALAAAKSRPRADVVTVTAPWSYDGLDKGIQRIGEAAEAILAKK